MREDNTRVQRFFNQLQNHPVMAVVIIVGIVIIGLATFTDSLDKLVNLAKKHLYDQPATQEQLQVRESQSTREDSTGRASDIDSATESAQQSGPIKKEKSLKKKQPKTSKTSSVSPTASFVEPSKIRTSVKAAVAALYGETTSDRVRSVKTLLPSLPDDLNAKEMALLAGSETTRHREQILQLLIKRTKPYSLQPSDIVQVLGNETTSNRVECIRIIVPYIKGPITGKQATAILASETYSHRVQCIRLIAPLLQQPLTNSEVQEILKGTSTSDRTEAIKLIFDYESANR